MILPFGHKAAIQMLNAVMYLNAHGILKIGFVGKIDISMEKSYFQPLS